MFALLAGDGAKRAGILRVKPGPALSRAWRGVNGDDLALVE
ncbi:MAG: hypothetical protein ACRD1P_08555 [Thermoanaerobaculia bacterium]